MSRLSSACRALVASWLLAIVVAGCGSGSAAAPSPTTATSTLASTMVTPAVAAGSAPAPSIPSAPPRLDAIGQGSLRIVDRFPLPNEGDVIDGPDGLWSLDRHDREVVDGQPVGSTFEVDPDSGTIRTTVPHAIGGRMDQGFGAIWMTTLAGNLDQLTRIDFKTHEIMRIRTGVGLDAEPESIAFGGGSVWVGNNFEGTVARVNPKTGEVLIRIPVSDPGSGGVRVATSAEDRVWFGETRSGTLMRIDPATERVAQTVKLPGGNVEQLAIDGSMLWASDGDHLDQVDTATGAIRTRLALRADQQAINLLVEGRDLWVLTVGPDELLRVDLDTTTIKERLALSSFSGEDVIGSPFGDIAFRNGIVWDRVGGYLLKIAHD